MRTPKPPVYSVDFETYYDAELSVVTLGPTLYADRLQEEDIYLVAVKGDNGLQYVGNPFELDWQFLQGANMINHNCGFEDQIFRRLRELGLDIPEPLNTWDTADLVAYCGYPRSLAVAAEALFNFKHNKAIRDTGMKAKRWNEMEPDFQKAVMEYALVDAELSLKIWNTLEAQWPENERLISYLSRKWASKGIPTDKEGLEKGLENLQQQLWEAKTGIPWADEYPPTSPKQLAIACREHGIPCPASTALDSEECAEWENKYGAQYPWIACIRDYRRINSIIKRVESMLSRYKDGWIIYDIKYWGAGITGRWSGAGGLNVQNFASKELYGFSPRVHIRAPKGYKWLSADLDQIEPRCSSWLTNETKALKAMAEGTSPYIVYARAAMGLGENETWEKNNPLYKLAKISVLGAGYLAGHHKFIDVFKSYGEESLLDLPLTAPDHTPEAYMEYLERVNKPQWFSIFEKADEMGRHRLLKSWELIMTYRGSRPNLMALSQNLSNLLKASATKGEDLELELPSKRVLLYRRCRFRRMVEDENKFENVVVADITRGGVRQTTRLHSGILIENLCQAMARDVFRDCLLRLYEAGILTEVNLHVHDEINTIVPVKIAEKTVERVRELMSLTPSWAPGLPVGASVHIVDTFAEAK